MTTQMMGVWQRFSVSRTAMALSAACLVALMVVLVVSGGAPHILQSATETSGQGRSLGCTAGPNTACFSSGPNIFDLVNNLLTPALVIVVALAPLAIAWGAGMMIFGGKHGPQLMGGAIVAVVLVAAAKGIAL